MVVAVKMVGWAFAVGKAFERCSIHEEDVGPSVVVVIEDGDPGPGGFDNVFFRLRPPKTLVKVSPAFPAMSEKLTAG